MARTKKTAAVTRKRKASEMETTTTAEANDPAQLEHNDEAGPSRAPVEAPQDPSEQEPPADDPTARLEQAFTMLLQMVPGLERERGMRALDSTAQHSEDLEAWAEEATIWLAIDNECADETKAMGEAMEISLVEAEERKACEKPLVEREGKEVLEQFKESDLLLTMDSLLGFEEVVKLINEAATELKSKLIDYLLLEQRCKRWYTCSKGYFTEASEELKQRIVENLAASQNQDEIRERKSAAVNKRKRSRSKGLEEEEKEEGGESVPTVLLSFLEERVQLLQEAVYLFRPDSDNETVPSIFESYTVEEVDLIDA